MKKRVFKYRAIGIINLIVGFLMLSFCAIGFYYTASEISVNSDYVVLVFIGLIMSSNIISLILILMKSSKSIIALNVFYGLIFLLFGIASISRELDQEDIVSSTDRIIYIILLFISFSLIFITNKFKYKNYQYQEIEFIGEHQE